jgi:hypothetical protein
MEFLVEKSKEEFGRDSEIYQKLIEKEKKAIAIFRGDEQYES